MPHLRKQILFVVFLLAVAGLTRGADDDKDKKAAWESVAGGPGKRYALQTVWDLLPGLPAVTSG